MVYLAHGSSVSLLANCVLEVNSRVPYTQEYIFAAMSEKEAEGWHDAIQASIRTLQVKMQMLMELLESGCTMHKYNYSNSKRSRRYFWIADEGKELCWGRSKGEDTQKVNLQECIGIIYGPMTTTFQRCTNLEDPAWTCFSLLFMGRTLDLAVAGDLQVHAWFLGLQHLISLHGIGSMPIMSDSQFILRKVQYKLTGAAHRNGLVLGRHLLERFRALAADRGLAGLGPGALVSGGCLATPMTALAPELASSSSGARGGRGRENGARDPAAGARISSLRGRTLQLSTMVRQKDVQLEVAEALLKRAAGLAKGALPAALREVALEALRKRCGHLEEEVRKLTEAAEEMAPQVKAAEKAERMLKKLQQKLEETEARRMALDRDLGSVHASTAESSGAKQSASTAEAQAKDRGVELQQRVQDLERQLQEVQGRQQADASVQNHRQDEAIRQAEQDRLSLAQRLETLGRDLARATEAEQASRSRLERRQDVNKKLGQAAAPLQAAVLRLKQEQSRTRTEILEVGRGFQADICKVLASSAELGARAKEFDEKYRVAMEDRKKLHNQVLDLKGNIRVFVRVRPINSKESSLEPEGEPTITFRDDTNIGVYDGQHARRKWFEFDQVFSPATQQEQVFEEAKPLATSVLDGYNVCVFAYGQTGSGKTHTMTGTSQAPGLNTRVLTELFRIREERQSEYDIEISLAITEIYNETIRDLLCPSPKKLDVKQNPDGTCGVPGLTDVTVTSVEDVLKCIGDASKNRATSTTEMNDQSSRSHSIVTVRTQCTLRGGDTYIGKIHLIDLAGSENTNKSGVTGQGMKEAQNINKSLSALGDVIQSLVAKTPHVPYRNSKLTMMLKDSLGGDSKTLMIVCSSPAQFNVTETLSSLNFAARARNVELGKAKRNVAS